MQLEVIFNGLTLGAGTFPIGELTGLHDTPDVDDADKKRPRQHGEDPGVDYNRARWIEAKFTLNASHPADDRNALFGAASRALVTGKRSELPLLATIDGLADGRQVRLNARVKDFDLPIDMAYSAGAGQGKAQWKCTDPLIYDALSTVLTAPMATVSGTGRTYPLTYPRVYGGAVSGGLLSANNEGEVDAPWEAVINGPVDNPRLENVTTGQTVAFSGNLAAGETLVLGSKYRDVLLNGIVSRYTWLTFTSEWFELEPGVNEIRFAGSSGSGTVQLTFASTWI